MGWWNQYILRPLFNSQSKLAMQPKSSMEKEHFMDSLLDPGQLYVKMISIGTGKCTIPDFQKIRKSSSLEFAAIETP